METINEEEILDKAIGGNMSDTFEIKPDSYYYVINKMVNVDENCNKTIADGYSIEDVLDKLSYYEAIEQYHGISEEFKILGKYRIHAQNYDAFKRIVAAYEMPIEEFLKDVENCDTRMKNTLKKAGINQVSDLINSKVPWSWQMLDKIPGIGKKSHIALSRALNRLKEMSERGKLGKRSIARQSHDQTQG